MSEEIKVSPPENPVSKLGDFLTTAPAGVIYQIPDLIVPDGREHWKTADPNITLYCESKECEGERIFSIEESFHLYKDGWKNDYVSYRCRNCRTTLKIYALFIIRSKEIKGQGLAVKIGEWPQLQISVPSKVISIIGPDREIFLKGLKAEAQGLGIGAFGYYRRVVDNQWQRIIEKLAKAAENIHAGSDAIKTLTEAAKETQFSRAIEKIKAAIPASLLIGGHHNPLALLYKATSKGIHELSDGQCLELAKDIRLVLTELAERMTKALSDQSALDTAVSRLLSIDGIEATNKSEKISN